MAGQILLATLRLAGEFSLARRVTPANGQCKDRDDVLTFLFSMNKRKTDESNDLRIESAKRALYYRYECLFHHSKGYCIVTRHNVDLIPLEDMIGCYGRKCKRGWYQQEIKCPRDLSSTERVKWYKRWWYVTEKRMGKLRQLCFDPVSQLSSKLPVPRHILMHVLSFV